MTKIEQPYFQPVPGMKTKKIIQTWTPKIERLPVANDVFFDNQAAEDAVYFFEECLTHTKGEWAGKPFNLLAWQNWGLIRPVFGWKRFDGRRWVRLIDTVFLFIPKKNGKTELGAGLALKSLAFDHEEGGEVYFAAVDREQAGLAFNVACDMINNDDDPIENCLKTRCKIIASRKRILYPSLKAFAQVLSSDVANKHGPSISCAIIDELHAHPTRDLYDVLTIGTGAARAQQLIFILTTAGDDKKHFAFQEYQKAKDILSGKEPENELTRGYYPIIFELEEGDDWENPDNWIKANPSLGETITIDGMKKEFFNAKRIPALIPKFKQLRLNIWDDGDFQSWINRGDWEKCNETINIDDLVDVPCYGGLDMSSINDLTAFVMAFDLGDKMFWFPHFWIPEENIKRRVQNDRVPYDFWVQKGVLKTTPGNQIDQDFIEKEIISLSEKFLLREINYDRWNTAQIVTHLENEGLEMIGFAQGAASYGEPIKETMRKVLAHSFIYNNNPILNWMSGNLVLTMDSNENFKPDKKKSREKIDGFSAGFMATDRLIRNRGIEDDDDEPFSFLLE